MLQLDVEKRLTATEALAHPYFELFRDIEEETEAQHSYDDSLEHEKLSIEEWKSKKFIFFESSMGLSYPSCFFTDAEQGCACLLMPQW